MQFSFKEKFDRPSDYPPHLAMFAAFLINTDASPQTKTAW
jgi:hypothetical protein